MNHSGRVQQKSKDKGNSSTLIGQGRFTGWLSPLFFTLSYLFLHVTEKREIDATPGNSFNSRGQFFSFAFSPTNNKLREGVRGVSHVAVTHRQDSCFVEEVERAWFGVSGLVDCCESRRCVGAVMAVRLDLGGGGGAMGYKETVPKYHFFFFYFWAATGDLSRLETCCGCGTTLT